MWNKYWFFFVCEFFFGQHFLEFGSAKPSKNGTDWHHFNSERDFQDKNQFIFLALKSGAFLEARAKLPCIYKKEKLSDLTGKTNKAVFLGSSE